MKKESYQRVCDSSCVKRNVYRIKSEKTHTKKQKQKQKAGVWGGPNYENIISFGHQLSQNFNDQPHF